MQTHPTAHPTTAPSSGRSVPVARRTGLLSLALARLTTVLTLRRHRRALLTLDPRLLRDIGLTEIEARREAERPLWDVPSHWRG